MSIKTEIKHWWIQQKTGHAYVYLIHRTNNMDGTGYNDDISFIKKSDMPKGAKKIQNMGKYWYFYDGMKPGIDQTPDTGTMTAADVCTWADNNDLDKSLAELWSWKNNIDLKKVALIVGVVVVAFALYTMVS